MLSENFRHWALLLVSSFSGGAALVYIVSAIERREWLSQEMLIGLTLMLFAIATVFWDDMYKRLAPTRQDITPSEGLKK
jgi:hypothetical protein